MEIFPPLSPHHGGVWESLIKTAKRSLYAILKEHAPTEETLRTLLAEVEHILNLRPLTHISVDSNDQEHLTPSHFLLGRPDSSSAMGEYGQQDLSSRKHWVRAQALADAYWGRWAREVLPLLAKRPKWAESENPLENGELVLIIDPSLERGRWARAVVVATYPDKRGCVRIVDILTHGKVYRRSISRIVRLGLKSATPMIGAQAGASGDAGNQMIRRPSMK